ncbi:hypothetical protein [Sphingomonas oligophenolica]|uniref:Large polyvalent protein associated domain-containing protein n=1 Tax=Sphingomonas oligophenolica TaxID=301154 RepID=A0A502C2R0_9SPHN|nr:hypothetical protein [Sphingomonas oligophenolica]TPG06359.1 hypothetical protein EAH84_14885 [Sphingomonas oligophenolica]
MSDQLDPYDQAYARAFGGVDPTRQSLVQTSHLNPDREVENRAIADQLGLPGQFIRDNEAEARRIKAQRDAAATAASIRGTKTASFLADTSKAAIAHDDVGVLAKIGHWFGENWANCRLAA